MKEFPPPSIKDNINLISISGTQERWYLPFHVGLNLCLTDYKSKVSLLEKEADDYHVENLCLSTGSYK